MNFLPKLDIPLELENYREAIESIVKPYIRILLAEEGILQFYIAQDMSYGYDSKNMMKQDRFRVIYFKNVDMQKQNIITDFSFLDPINEYNFPIEGCSTIRFQFDYTTLDDDYSDCFNIFGIDGISENIYEIYEAYIDEMTFAGHKLLGNPDFTQQDPRYFLNTEEPYILLFQIDSDINQYIDIMWGDSGVANFFITQSDLKKLDFTKVMYNWDCF